MQKIKSTVLALMIALTFCTVAFAEDTKAKRIDINTATEDQLKAMPGIGNEDAKKIIAGRPYAKKDDLKTRKVIAVDSYEKIKKLLDSLC